MTIFELTKRFSSEKDCREDFKIRREQKGLYCKKCSCEKHYWLSKNHQWECSSCKFRTGLRSGTFMEHSKLPFLLWYRTMILISFSKKGLSSLEIQRQLGQNRYESTWAMVHKIRKAMSKVNHKEQLQGTIEFDEGYFSVATPQKSKKKRGRGSQKKAKVAVMVESVPLEDPISGFKHNWLGRFKMEVLEGHQMNKIDQLLERKIKKKSLIITDKSSSYGNIKRSFDHSSKLSQEHTNNNSLKWVHIGISNAKRKLLGINHRIKKEYLQNYLDEFCFKLNRRKGDQPLIDPIINAVALDYL